MNMNLLYLLSIVATSVEMTACLICARQLWRMRGDSPDRSRRLLAMGSIVSALMAAVALWGSIAAPALMSQSMLLPPWLGLVYMSMHIIMTLYPISVVRPDWITPRHFFVLFLPILVFGVLYLFFIGRWTVLTSPADIWSNWTTPDVLDRLCALFVMLPYCLILFALPYNYRRSSASFWWVVSYSVGITIICVAHIVLMLNGNPVLIILLPLLAASFYILSTEYELEDRLSPGANVSTESAPMVPSSADDSLRELELWDRVCRLMDQDQIWRDPDLSLSAMARSCATNVTYLNQAIQQNTGGGFKELLNTKRIASVVAQLQENPGMDIQEAFFNAGYRSRTTAWRNFKEIMGVTPTNYLQSQK